MNALNWIIVNCDHLIELVKINGSIIPIKGSELALLFIDADKQITELGKEQECFEYLDRRFFDEGIEIKDILRVRSTEGIEIKDILRVHQDLSMKDA